MKRIILVLFITVVSSAALAYLLGSTPEAWTASSIALVIGAFVAFTLEIT